MPAKKFFVKDFVQYVTPCFGCDRANDLSFAFINKGSGELKEGGRVKAIVTDKYVQVDLHIRYSSTLTLWIFHKTNKIVTSEDVNFSNFLAKRDLFLVGHCGGCETEIMSNKLDFQTFNKVVGPTTINH